MSEIVLDNISQLKKEVRLQKRKRKPQSSFNRSLHSSVTSESVQLSVNGQKAFQRKKLPQNADHTTGKKADCDSENQFPMQLKNEIFSTNHSPERDILDNNAPVNNGLDDAKQIQTTNHNTLKPKSKKQTVNKTKQKRDSKKLKTALLRRNLLSQEGHHETIRRKAVVIRDDKLPSGWAKHAIQRRGGSSAGKWDVFLVSPLGRKFRSRNELITYFREIGELFPKEKFDFSLRQKKSADVVLRSVPLSCATAQKVEVLHPSCGNKVEMNENMNIEQVPQRRIKTLLPRIRVNAENTLSSYNVPKVPDTTSSELQIQLQKYLPHTSHEPASDENISELNQDRNHPATFFLASNKINSTFGKTKASQSFLTDIENDNITTDNESWMLNLKQEPYENIKTESLPSNECNKSIQSAVNCIEQLRSQEIINCMCGIMEEDGLMIQCDICQCWQHALCNNIEHENEVPEKFACCFCQLPTSKSAGSSKFPDQSCFYKGLLPSLSCVTNQTEATAQQEKMFQVVHSIISELILVKEYLHTMQVKINIAETPNHPKLILWNKCHKSDKHHGNDNCSNVTGSGSTESAFNNTDDQTSDEIMKKSLFHNEEKEKAYCMKNVKVEPDSDNILKPLSKSNNLNDFSIAVDYPKLTREAENTEKLLPLNLKQMSDEGVKTNIKDDKHDYPQPEAAIDFDICLKRLMNDIKKCQKEVSSWIQCIEDKIKVVEEDFDLIKNETSTQNLKEIIKLLIDDIKKMGLVAKYMQMEM